MTNLKRFSSVLSAAALLGLGLGGAGVASADVILNAGNAACSAYIAPPSQPNVEAHFQANCATGPVDELYKANFVSGQALGDDSGSLYADSYQTLFDPLDGPVDAIISHVAGMLAIGGYEAIFVLAKDGNHNPTYYGWDITGLWDGVETIAITAWLDIPGSISNVSIWGRRGDTPSVPEPGPLGLLGAGLIAMYWARRRIATR